MAVATCMSVSRQSIQSIPMPWIMGQSQGERRCCAGSTLASPKQLPSVSAPSTVRLRHSPTSLLEPPPSCSAQLSQDNVSLRAGHLSGEEGEGLRKCLLSRFLWCFQTRSPECRTALGSGAQWGFWGSQPPPAPAFASPLREVFQLAVVPLNPIESTRAETPNAVSFC